MPGVDFDALRTLEPESSEPFTYRLGGRDFTAVRTAPAAPIAAASVKMRGADGPDTIAQMVGVIFTLTVKAQHRQLRKVILSTKDPISPDVIVALFWVLCEHYTPELTLPPPAEPEPEPKGWSDEKLAKVLAFAARHGGEVNLDG